MTDTPAIKDLRMKDVNLKTIAQLPVMEKPGFKQVKAGARWVRERRALAGWEDRVLPDLILAGAQRSGTTALTEALYRMPMVDRPRRGKGSHYFSYNYYRGPEWFQSQFPTNKTAAAIKAETGSDLFCFDACPYYLFHPFAVERMSELLPDVKVLIMLRDPVRRAESHYHHSVSHGHEELPFAEALEAEEARLAPEIEKMRHDIRYWSLDHEHHSYITKGYYADQLEKLFGYYPREQVLVLQSEAFYADSNAVLRRVTDWCGLPPVTLEKEDNRNSHEYKKMDEEMRARLIEAYREPNQRLYELLGETWDWLS